MCQGPSQEDNEKRLNCTTGWDIVQVDYSSGFQRKTYDRAYDNYKKATSFYDEMKMTTAHSLRVVTKKYLSEFRSV